MRPRSPQRCAYAPRAARADASGSSGRPPLTAGESAALSARVAELRTQNPAATPRAICERLAQEAGFCELATLGRVKSAWKRMDAEAKAAAAEAETAQHAALLRQLAPASFEDFVRTLSVMPRDPVRAATVPHLLAEALGP